MDQVRGQFDGDFQVHFNLAPPLFARRDPTTGRLRKHEYGPWMMKTMRILARLRFLRGTALDVFGYTAERKMERQLAVDYETRLRSAFELLSPANHSRVIALAEVPELIKGYGHVKDTAVAAAKKTEQAIWESLN